MLYPKFYLNNNHFLQKKLFIFTSILILWFCLFHPQAAFSAKDNHAGLDSAEAEVCFKCHKDLAKPPPNGYVHVPFATGDCMVCHELTKNNKFKVIDTGEVLCYMCHDPKNTKKEVHAPVESGDCTMCHSPHQSSNPYQLLDAPVSKLCFNCHEDDKTTHKYVHAPVAAGECTICHDPHESPYPFRLPAEGKDVCLMCHVEKEEAIKTKKYVHAAIELVGCTGCHSPHGTENKYQLLMPPPELCYSCHSDKEEHIKKAKTPHGAIQAKGSCINCHDPHASDFPMQLKAEETMDLCLKCHNRAIKTDKGRLINMKRWLKDRPQLHGPILMNGDCAACHNPHGSDEFRMLRRAFPSTFYTEFAPEKYNLCFECHDEELVKDKETFDSTGFRNGETNLHYVHVKKDPKKGRRCVVCHDIHASKGPKHIREITKFGKWEFPLKFKIEDNGGSCAPACHFPRKYNREKAVKNR